LERRSRLDITPRLVIGAAAILALLFLLMSLETLSTHRDVTTRLLLEKGEALIRSFEAAARTGRGLKWQAFEIRKLLIETARQPGVDYIIITDVDGTILADSDPARIGEVYFSGLDLKEASRLREVRWRRVQNPEGADTFEVYRRFLPLSEPGEVFEGAGDPSGYVIFLGLDMGPVLAARREEMTRVLGTALILLLVGVSGIVSLLVVQRYRSARASLSHVQAFSDHLVENIPAGLVALDRGGRVAAYNPAAEAILGRPPAAVLGLPYREALPGPIGDLFGELETRKAPFSREMEFQGPDGRSRVLHIDASLFPAGEGEGLCVLMGDMTDIRALQEEAARNRRLAAMGDLAAGVAHEIRNPLSSIKGFATYFRERYGDDPEDGRIAAIMIEEVERLNRVITQLLDLARPLRPSLTVTDLGEVVDQALSLVAQRAAGRGVHIVREGEAPCPALIDGEMITQVLLNLFLNALTAMENGGTLTVSWRREGGEVEVTVKDTGTGIAPADRERIFDPYFTTRPGGTGLGLAVASRIMEAHGGFIRVDSEVGRGSVFTLVLPAGDDKEGEGERTR